MSEKRVTMKAPKFSGLPDFEMPAEADVKLARILRRAAGLDDLPDPLERKPDGMPRVYHYVTLILSNIPEPVDYRKFPRPVARELEKLQLDLGDIRRRIEKIDTDSKSWLNRFGSQNYREFKENSSTDDGNRKKYIWDDLCEEPLETWTVPAAVAAIQRLERAMPAVIMHANFIADRTPASGKKKNMKARRIAFVVARYVREVTGDLPGPRLRYSGSDFERTLDEIFELFEINADAQAPARAVLLKLAQND